MKQPKTGPYRGFLSVLDDSKFVRGIARRLSLRAIVDRLFGAFRFEYRTPRRSLRYRIENWNGWLGHKEWEDKPKLDRILEGRIDTLIDLGTNSGFFSLAVFDRQSLSDVLWVEANRELIPALEALVERNGLTSVTVLSGAAGAGLPPGAPVLFAIGGAHLGSHLKDIPSSISDVAPLRYIEIPSLSVWDAWKSKTGGKAIDLLKIDIEGAEYRLLQTEPELFTRARRVLVEWHHGVAPRAEGEASLAKFGFRRTALFFDRLEVSQGLYESMSQ